MKMFAGIGAILLGAFLFGMGLLFLLGADGQFHRLVVAALGLLLGASAGMAGALLLFRAVMASPDRVRPALLALAKTRDGELTLAEIQANLGGRAKVAEEILGLMLVAGDCERRGDTFLFPALQPRVVIRRCGHCGHEAPLASDDERCPSCGASMTVRRETKAEADDGLYRMDE
jgi:hypothetical protein